MNKHMFKKKDILEIILCRENKFFQVKNWNKIHCSLCVCVVLFIALLHDDLIERKRGGSKKLRNRVRKQCDCKSRCYPGRRLATFPQQQLVAWIVAARNGSSMASLILFPRFAVACARTKGAAAAGR